MAFEDYNYTQFNKFILVNPDVELPTIEEVIFSDTTPNVLSHSVALDGEGTFSDGEEKAH